MTEQEIFEFLAKNLKVHVNDASTGQNWVVLASLGVSVSITLTNPETGKNEVISQDSCSIG